MIDQQTPAGWYPTPDGRQRYWDGSQWTEQYAPASDAAGPGAATAKKGGALKWVLLGIGLVMVLIVGSCVAMVASAGNEVSKALESASTELEGTDTGTTTGTDGSGDENNPVEITEGAAFDVRDFSYAAGWKVTDSGFGMEIEGLKVTNNRGEKDSAIVDIKFWKGTEVLSDVTCSSDPVLPGTTVTLTCLSADDKPTSFDKITISDTF